MLLVLAATALLAGPYRTELPTDESPLSLTATGDGSRLSEPFSDRALRIRLRGARRYDATLLWGEDGRRVGFRLEGRNVTPLAETGGELQRVDLPTWIGPRRPGRRALDLTLRPFAGAILLTVSDPSGEVLALAHGPGAPSTGRLHLSLASDTELEYVAMRRLCTAIPEDDGPPITAVVDDPNGLTRLESTPKGVVVRTTPAGLEKMNCDGRAVHDVATVLPWKHVDPTTLAALDSELGAGSIDVAESYHDAARVEAILRRWHRAHPERTRLEQLGVSHAGRPIWALAIADALVADDPRPTLLLNGAHHGDELLSVSVVLDAAQQLLTSSHPSVARLRARVVTWFVPLVNPDGNAVFLSESSRAGRKNGRDLDGDGRRGLLEGVDLNRNYPFEWDAQCSPSCRRASPESLRYRGPAPASEPETRAMMALVERERFVASLSFHMGTIAVLYPHAGATDPRLTGLASHVATALGRHPRGTTFSSRPPHDDVRGSDQDWYHHAVGTYALLIEIYGWPPPLTAEERREVIEAIRPAWLTAAAFVAAQNRSTSSR